MVERGSPHSLCLLESGKVKSFYSIEALYGHVISDVLTQLLLLSSISLKAIVSLAVCKQLHAKNNILNYNY